MSDDVAKGVQQAAEDIGKALSDAAKSENVQKAQAQAKETAEQAAQKMSETLTDLQKNESVKKAEEQAKAAAEELGKGLKSLGGFLKKKAEEVTKK